MTELKKDCTRRHIKKVADSEEHRRRRTDTTIRLRKDKKTESLAKRRNMTTATVVPPEAPTQIPPDDMMDETNVMANQTATTSQENEIPKRIYTIDDIPLLYSTLHRSDATDSEVLEATKGFRRMLSMEKNPPVEDVIRCGVLPTLVSLLSREDNTMIQFEAAWSLTNIASTDQTAVVVDNGGIPPLAALLLSANPDVREQSAWCLGNIAGDSPRLRDMVLEVNAMDALIQNIIQPANESLLGNCVWALSNLCRGKPHPRMEYVRKAVPCLAHLIQQKNKSVIMDATWALSYLSDGEDERIQAVMDGGVVPHLISLLSNESSSVITPAVRTLGNFVSGNDTQTQMVIDCGILQHIKALLKHSKRSIRKETCWLLSNIAAGTRQQISSLMSIPKELALVISALANSEWEVRKEAVWVVSNIATGGSHLHIQAIVELGAIESLCSMLTVADAKIVLVTLNALEAILKVGERLGKAYNQVVDEFDGIDKIEGLQQHEDDNVYKKAVYMIEQFFSGEEDEDENLAPPTTGDAFVFGMQKGMAGDQVDKAAVPMQPFNFGASTNPC